MNKKINSQIKKPHLKKWFQLKTGWNYLIVFKQMSFESYKNVTFKLST